MDSKYFTRSSRETPPSGIDLYARFALSGAICCAVTHGSLTPIDVVKTRMQLEPAVYKNGMLSSFKQVIKAEGAGALLTGLGPTVSGYFLQGGFKFGGYELWKKIIINYVGIETATKNRTAVYLVSSAIAEFFASIALCPLEATRIRLVSQPNFSKGFVSGFARIFKEEGFFRGFYSGFAPILFKQVPYTMTKFVVYEHASEAILKQIGPSKEKPSSGVNTSVNLGAGLIAGIAAAIISQPADTILSKINKQKGVEGSVVTRLATMAKELGPRGLFLGLGARTVIAGALTSGQFAIYGDIKRLLGATGGVELVKAN